MVRRSATTSGAQSNMSTRSTAACHQRPSADSRCVSIKHCLADALPCLVHSLTRRMGKMVCAKKPPEISAPPDITPTSSWVGSGVRVSASFQMFSNNNLWGNISRELYCARGKYTGYRPTYEQCVIKMHRKGFNPKILGSVAHVEGSLF